MTRAAATLLLLTLACGGGEHSGGAPASTSGQASGAASDVARNASTSGPAPAAKPACAHTGAWDACTIAERLDHSGLAPKPLDKPASNPLLGAPNLAYTLGRADLLLWIYPDRKAREAAQARLGRVTYLTPDEDVGMNALPTLIASENLLALLDSRNEHQRERVSDAITAGPPQPSR